MEVVDGTTPKPASINAEGLAIWVKKEGQVVGLLCQAIEEKILKYVMSCKTSKAIQEKLAEVHDQHSHESIHHV